MVVRNPFPDKSHKKEAQRKLGREVFTKLGKGRIVYQLPDGTLVVEFEHGGGCIFTPHELFSPNLEENGL